MECGCCYTARAWFAWLFWDLLLFVIALVLGCCVSVCVALFVPCYVAFVSRGFWGGLLRLRVWLLVWVVGCVVLIICAVGYIVLDLLCLLI